MRTFVSISRQHWSTGRSHFTPQLHSWKISHISI